MSQTPPHRVYSSTHYCPIYDDFFGLVAVAFAAVVRFGAALGLVVGDLAVGVRFGAALGLVVGDLVVGVRFGAALGLVVGARPFREAGFTSVAGS